MELFIDSDPNLLKTVPTLDDIIQLRTYNTEAFPVYLNTINSALYNSALTENHDMLEIFIYGQDQETLAVDITVNFVNVTSPRPVITGQMLQRMLEMRQYKVTSHTPITADDSQVTLKVYLTPHIKAVCAESAAHTLTQPYVRADNSASTVNAQTTN